MAGRRVLIRECVHDAYLWSAEDGRTINGRTTWAMRGRVPQVAYADTRVADFSISSRGETGNSLTFWKTRPPR
jgi:hypothetical protein